MSASRLVLVAAPCPNGEFSLGTGHVVTDRHVLTGAHVLGEATTAQVRGATATAVHSARVVWSSSEDDATLLEVDDASAWSGIAPERWGRYSLEDDAEARCVGFPRATGVTTPSLGSIRETADAGGRITAAGGQRQGLIELQPRAAPGNAEAWKGLSGAAVLCDGHLVGVVRSGPKGADGQRLWATPVERLLADPAFAERVGRPVARVVPTLPGLGDLFAPLPEDPGPAHLLDARHQVAPFVWEVRRGERALLEAWCAGPAPMSTLLLTGAGGAGKSRLLGEWCLRCHAERWRVGFVAEHTTTTELRAMTRGVRPTLLVLDYAERRSALGELLGSLALGAEVPKLRVVLLSRTAGDWWSLLQQQAEGPVRDLLAGVEPHELAPVQLDGEARRGVYEAAASAFARLRGAGGARPRDLADRRYGRPLYLQMAALADVDGLHLDAPKLLDGVLAHEERFWARRFRERFGDAYDLDAFVRQARHGVAALTLRGGASSRAEGEAVLREAGGVAPADVRRFWRFLRDLQPTGRDGVRGLEPDLLGEALVRRVLRAAAPAGEYLERALRGADARAMQQAFAVLGGIELSGEHLTGGWMETVLSADVGGRAVPAFHAVLGLSTRSAFSTLGDRLTEVLEQHGNAHHAREMEPGLPGASVALRALAVWVTRTRLTEPELDGEERAGLLNNLGNRLGALGRREEALAAAQEAVDLHRPLTAARPDEFLPDLAGSLNNLGNRLSDLGRREEALAAAQEAVNLYHQLAAARPDAFLPDLAMSLNNLGSGLRALGRREEALAAAQEAVDLDRQLASGRSDAFLPDLAGSLNNLSTVLSDLGQREEARAASQETVDLLRHLAAARPDAFLPDLATSLANLGAMLRELGRREEALAVAQEAVDLYRQLASGHPDAFAPNLASCLANLGATLSDLGLREGGLAAAKEAVELYRQLVADRPDAFLPDLATSLSNLGNRFGEHGRREEALAAVQEAVELYRQLAAARPEAFLPNLAASLNNLGNMLSELAQGKEALTVAQEAVAALTPHLVRHPAAFAAWMGTMVRNYLTCCEALGQAPDQVLLAPVTTALETLSHPS